MCFNVCTARPQNGLPKHVASEVSAKETTSSVVVDNDGTSEGPDMEVEVIEHALGDSTPSAKGSVPKHTLSPIASTSSPKGKGKAKGAQKELEDIEVENARLKEENVCLRAVLLLKGLMYDAHIMTIQLYGIRLLASP